jgi:hypothetical protein
MPRLLEARLLAAGNLVDKPNDLSLGHLNIPLHYRDMASNVCTSSIMYQDSSSKVYHFLGSEYRGISTNNAWILMPIKTYYKRPWALAHFHYFSFFASFFLLHF